MSEEVELLREVARQLFNEGVQAKIANREYLERIKNLEAEVDRLAKACVDWEERYHKLDTERRREHEKLEDH